MRRKAIIGVSVTALVVVVAALLSVVWRSGLFRSDPDKPVAIATADLSDTGPGSLISATTMPELARSKSGANLHAARVVYRSTSGDSGAPTVVSGSVFVPLGPAPSGGWPVIAFAHGTTGINEPCGPSLSASLLGNAPAVSSIVDGGYAVAFPDYQGLGADGIHPYPDARTAGYNVIDSVRALRHVFPDISDRWAAVGGSQGGGAVWAADEEAGTYAPELHLVGAAAFVPAADVTGLVDKAKNQTMTYEQRLVYIAIVESLGRLHADLNRDDYRRGAAAKYWEVLTACSGPMVADRDAAANAVQASDLSPDNPVAADRLRALLARWALPRHRLAAPLSIFYAGEDEFIDVDWTTKAIARACALGGDISWQLNPKAGHGDVNIKDSFGWIADRFADKPAANQCGEHPTR